MYKVKRKSEGNLTSQGITFEFGKEVVVAKLVYDYLKKTFLMILNLLKKKKKMLQNQTKKLQKRKMR